MDDIKFIYWLNESFGPPHRYLGTNVENLQLEDGSIVWSTNCVDCLRSTIDNLNNSLGVDKAALNNYGKVIELTHPITYLSWTQLKNW